MEIRWDEKCGMIRMGQDEWGDKGGAGWVG